MTATTADKPGVASAASPVTLLRVGVLVALMAVAAVAGETLQPTNRMSETKTPIVLEKQVPEAFGEWRLDTSIRPVLPDPGLQAMLDTLYSQTLARTYINPQGQRVMLSIAYGSDQSNEATAVHRPEFCYSAQGFRVKLVDREVIDIGGTKVPVARVLAQLGQRNEPITYWVTLDEAATLPGLGRKLQQIKYGLQGQIPDGMLVRVSSISPSLDDSFSVQQRFLEQMHAAVPAEVRKRYFGAAQASDKV
ncbi:MAG: EpsI family protein, partial [Rubrivivax sp.]|nr:EpsI family protein [Rubrivivax sp.]